MVDSVQHVARLSEALSTLLVPHELEDAENAQPLKQAQGAVEFVDVNFAYPGSLVRAARTSICGSSRASASASVGRSGSGKSTVLALLQRLRDVSSGTVLIDGKDIASLTQDSLRAGDLGRAAGRDAVPSLRAGEHPLRQARGDR